MNRKSIYTAIILLFLISLAWGAFPHEAEAQASLDAFQAGYSLAGGGDIRADIGKAVGNFAKDVVGSFLNITMGVFFKAAAFVTYLGLNVASWFLILCAILLNVGMYLTTHLGLFIENNPVIFTVWGIIRDIASIVLIFVILWAAIQMILGIQQANYGSLIRNILIMGILINFSFFFARVLIDASNIVSLQFYSAISPQTQDILPQDNLGAVIGKIVNNQTSGGLADVIMNSVKVTQFWENRDQISGKVEAAGDDVASLTLIILANITGIVIQILTALSFLIAAVATVWRTAVLIFLLAFSAIWIAAMALPQLKEASSMWMKHFKSNLLFLPAYLLMMYVAIRIISESGFNNLVSVLGKDAPEIAYIQLFVGGAIIIFMINIPFFAAAKFAGAGAEWTEKWYSGLRGWTQKKFTSGTKWAAGTTWTNTGGRAASAFARSETLKNFAAKSWLGETALKGVRKTGSTYQEKLDAQVKSRTDFAESLGVDKNLVRSREIELRKLERDQADLRASGDKDGAKAMDEDIKGAKKAIEAAKNTRKSDYAKRTRSHQVDTLWTKIARKDKVAAAKIQGEIYKKQVDEAKKSLEKLQDKIKNSQNTIDNLQNQLDSGQARKPVEAKKKIDELDKKLKDSYLDEQKAIRELANLEAKLAPYENVS